MRRSLRLPVVCALAAVGACAQPSADRGAIDRGAADRALRTLEQEVVYGVDDRLEPFEHPDARLRELAIRSSVAMVSSRAVDTSDPENVRLASRSLQDLMRLCDGEVFADQPTAADCSGTLIDDDLVLTAGHCVSSDRACAGSSWVFNYRYESPGELAVITADDVFSCSSVVARSNSGWTSSTPDYAIIRLDRSAAPRFEPAPVNLEEFPVAVGDPVALIGFGSGLPMKIDSGGRVTDERRSARTYFLATLDAFGGHSGGGVFDVHGRVVGVLTAGEADYIRRDGCRRVATLDEDGGRAGGEQVTYAILAVDDYCASGGASVALCGSPELCGDGVCSLGESHVRCPEDCAPDQPVWRCEPEFYGSGDGCDCGCGAPDPDCDDASAPVIGCEDGEVCDELGLCAETPDGPSNDVDAGDSTDGSSDRDGAEVGFDASSDAGSEFSDLGDASDPDAAAAPVEVPLGGAFTHRNGCTVAVATRPRSVGAMPAAWWILVPLLALRCGAATRRRSSGVSAA